ncbi:hypothetical protein DPMN_009839 [Dreissena polymorpha]|uniref:Uncharacterized protein n=1 Tax=Dreissena polymorpha TaxID=45954 RepID=A0A9D4S0E5_DREPO|nr:hypothetical protein DPMN_009839 [Dreissena polymorpha]
MMMEKRQIYVEKAKNIVLEPEPEERKSSKSSKVRQLQFKELFQIYMVITITYNYFVS